MAGSADDTPTLLARIMRGHWVGRLHEMAEADAVWQRAASGQGQVLLISGEPGIGKTRFVRELASVARAAGASVLAGECYSEGSAPYAPLAQIISDLLGSTDQGALDLPSETLANLAMVVPALRNRFPGQTPKPAVAPQSAHFEIFESFTAICVALSAQKPLLLFIDDVHWADSDTLSLLRNLARQIRKLPLLLVMTYREAEAESTPYLKDLLLQLNRERLAIHLGLAPLDRDETRDLLAAMFANDVAPEFLDRIYNQTEGNPFFIEEVCKALIEGGQFAFRDGSWHYPVASEIKIPQTVRAAIQDRLLQLPNFAQEALRMAAVLGGEFDFETLRRASSLDEESLVRALESALQAQLIAEVQPGRGGAVCFGFVHVLIPTTLRESVMHVRRQKLHLQAAQAIEAVHPDDLEALAYQYAEAGESGRAREYYRRAGDRARQTAPGDAARFYRAALEWWPEDDRAGQAELLSHLGYCLWLIGDVPEALKCFEDAYTLFVKLENRTQSGEMQRMIGRMYWERADRALALEHYHQALALLEQGPETPELANAISSISQMYMLAAIDDQAIAWGQRALVLARRLGAEDVVVHALNNIGSSYAQGGDFDQGVAILRESLQRSLAAGLPADACRAYYNLGVMLQRQCRYADARELMQELHIYASKVYAKVYANIALLRLTWLDWLTGRWRSALAYRAQMSEFRNDLYDAWAKRIEGMIDLDLDRIEDGRRALEESLPNALSASDIQTTIPHWGHLLRAYAASGQEAKTREVITRMLEFVSDTERISDESIMPLLFVCQQADRLTQPNAAEPFLACLTQLERHAQTFRTGEAAAALAEAKGYLAVKTDPGAAAEHFRQAAVEWERIERPYDQARALSAQGQALAAAGDKAAGKMVWQKASDLLMALADQLDMESRTSFLNSPTVRMVRQAESEGPHSRARQALNALTDRELEVLRLVAQGLTNAQIAEQLVVSPLTVNAHLRSIFNKLDVTTRTAATRLALERGWV